jgi:hypothetical protein
MKRNIFREMKTATIVRIIITQATRHRAQGAISQTTFEKHIQRIAREELEPKGLTLLVRDLPGGRTRFIIKAEATSTVCEMLDFDANGVPESNSCELLEPVLRGSEATTS